MKRLIKPVEELVTRDRYERNEKRIRDAIIFAVGIFGTINELAIQGDPRPYALVFLASLIGVPFILNQDAKKQHADGDSGSKRDDRS